MPSSTDAFAMQRAGSGNGVFRAGERELRIRERTRGSLQRFERSLLSLAGGCSSGLRRMAKPYPLFFERGSGSRIFDVDGNAYIDYALGWGPLILGHAPAAVVEAISRQAALGMTFGAQHDLEYEVAERLAAIIPCAGSVCFANSGTEIVQLALRLARAATQRNGYIKFEGHYHGWSDSVLVSYHPTAQEIRHFADCPVPVGRGQIVPDQALIAQWNDCDSIAALFSKHAQDISAVICEPMLCNSGCIPPRPGFLEFLREITRQHGALLIFDEVITGFRLDLKGAQGFYNVTPDLATYAKALGAGTPVSVLAGSAQLMNLIAKGEVIHSGTLNGSPLVLAAVKAALDLLSSDADSIYPNLWRLGERLRTGLEKILRSRGYKALTAGGGPVFQLSFMDEPAWNYRDTLKADNECYGAFVLALLDEGVMALPDGRWYLSAAHSDADIDATLAAVEAIAAQ